MKSQLSLESKALQDVMCMQEPQQIGSMAPAVPIKMGQDKDSMRCRHGKEDTILVVSIYTRTDHHHMG